MLATSTPKKISAQNSLRKLYLFYFISLFACLHFTIFFLSMAFPALPKLYRERRPRKEFEVFYFRTGNSLEIKSLFTF